RWREMQCGQAEPYRVLPEEPARFISGLRDVTAAISDHLAESSSEPDGTLLRFHFDALHFLRLIDVFGAHSIIDLSIAPDSSASPRNEATLTLRNLLPAPHLRARFKAARACVLFSATLTPLAFHRDTLGLPDDSAWIDVEAPFVAGQLAVRIARDVSTRYHDRGASLGAVADIIARQFDAAPGNYLAFFSSFEYLLQVAACFAERHPAVPIWAQSRGMPSVDRDAFLDRFTEVGTGVGFAVLGGSFGEGIDLPGRRLVGAFVATLGLPPFDPVNQHMRQRMEADFPGAGYQYAYLYPAIQKVVQAVGRVIRTPDDRGVVHLIDDRFARPDVIRLLPAWWNAAAPHPL
ncbi:MAG: ATP-dependent DNA helicase, partial [Caldimonas sp.]